MCQTLVMMCSLATSTKGDISSQVTKWGVAVTQLQLVEGLVYCGKGGEFMGHKGAGCLDLVYCGNGGGRG